MAKFLLTWELGGALGHLATLRALAGPLAERGHEVTLALRDLKHAERFFPDMECSLAPTYVANGPSAIAEPSTFADVLAISGWSKKSDLQTLVERWHTLFDETEPDVVVCNFSPTAVLALQGRGSRTITLGTGYGCPPDLSPLPDLCPWRDNYPDRLLFTEQQVLRTLNEQLTSQGVPEVEHVTQLSCRADANLLTTLPEMDHYQDRTDGEYIGPWGELAGNEPVWPSGTGPANKAPDDKAPANKEPRVFAYLKPMESLSYLLSELQRLALPTLVYAPSAAETVQAFETDQLRVAKEPLDMRRVAQECDLAILNAGHNATLRLLLGGKPILALPISGEQYLVAQNVERLGAGICVPPNQPNNAVLALRQLLAEERFTESAQQFAAKHDGLADESSAESIVKRLEQIL